MKIGSVMGICLLSEQIPAIPGASAYRTIGSRDREEKQALQTAGSPYRLSSR